jgi:hypothetical protein
MALALLGLLSIVRASLVAPVLGGLDSVFKRRKTPDTAYVIGYVKYEDERFGSERDGEGDWEDCEDSVLVGIE